MGSIKNMYRPKKSNVDKLNSYVEKLEKNGELSNDSSDRSRSERSGERKTN